MSSIATSSLIAVYLIGGDAAGHHGQRRVVVKLSATDSLTGEQCCDTDCQYGSQSADQNRDKVRTFHFLVLSLCVAVLIFFVSYSVSPECCVRPGLAMSQPHPLLSLPLSTEAQIIACQTVAVIMPARALADSPFHLNIVNLADNTLRLSLRLCRWVLGLVLRLGLPNE
jgi:hypothetical protein